MYLKSHSYGEYVFDHSWAQAHERLTGKRYYPKLQSAVPFTPVTGSRLLAKAGKGRSEVVSMLASSLVAIADEMDVSGLHITFHSEREANSHFTSENGYLLREGLQYHWENKGYGTDLYFLSLYFSTFFLSCL